MNLTSLNVNNASNNARALCGLKTSIYNSRSLKEVLPHKEKRPLKMLPRIQFNLKKTAWYTV